MVISHIIQFLVDYFTNLNVKKIIGGIIVIIGLAFIGKMSGSADSNMAVLYAVIGIVISGVGLAVIYYDIAKDRSGTRYNELETISKAYQNDKSAGKKASTWHMRNESIEKDDASRT